MWFTRNKWVHERNFTSGKKIADLTKSYVQEQIMMSSKIEIVTSTSIDWKPPDPDFVKINFNDAFDHSQHRSASGLIARNADGQVLASRYVLHVDIITPFAAEARACD